MGLAHLETPERAKAVLNKARKAVRTSHEIWIAAGRHLEQEAISHPSKSFEEHSKELEDVNKTIEVGVREPRRHQVLLTQEQWLKDAERCESEGSPRTCDVIIKATVAMEIEEDRLDTCVGGGRDYEIRIGVCIPIERAYGERLPTWRRHAVHGMFLHLQSLCLTTDETIL